MSGVTYGKLFCAVIHPPFTSSGFLNRKFARPAAHGYGHVRAVTRARGPVHTPAGPGAHVGSFHRPGWGVGWGVALSGRGLLAGNHPTRGRPLWVMASHLQPFPAAPQLSYPVAFAQSQPPSPPKSWSGKLKRKTPPQTHTQKGKGVTNQKGGGRMRGRAQVFQSSFSPGTNCCLSGEEAGQRGPGRLALSPSCPGDGAPSDRAVPGPPRPRPAPALKMSVCPSAQRKGRVGGTRLGASPLLLVNVFVFFK